MAPLTLLRNAELYAPAKLGRHDILVGGGSVLAVSSSPISLADGLADVVDLQGARVIPGLIDAHVHVTGGGGEKGPASRVPAVLLSELTRAGITSCVGVLGTDGTTRNVASLVASTLALRQEGLSAWCWTGSYEVPPITLTGTVRGDITFVDAIIGVGEIAISDHRSSQPTETELARLAADCHVAGLMSGKAGILHLHLGDGIRGLDLVQRILDTTELPARVFHPTHVNRKRALFKESIELAKRGCTIDVTAFPVEEGEDAYSAEDAIELYLKSDAPKERLTCSSDGGGCLPKYNEQGELLSMDTGRPSAVAETLATLLRRGHPMESVLPFFTSNVATLLRLSAKGCIGPGMDADLVILDEKHEVSDVMACGRFMVRSKKPTVRGMFERQYSEMVEASS